MAELDYAGYNVLHDMTDLLKSIDAIQSILQKPDDDPGLRVKDFMTD